VLLGKPRNQRTQPRRKPMCDSQNDGVARYEQARREQASQTRRNGDSHRRVKMLTEYTSQPAYSYCVGLPKSHEVVLERLSELRTMTRLRSENE
jgi:hypothetical protein